MLLDSKIEIMILIILSSLTRDEYHTHHKIVHVKEQVEKMNDKQQKWKIEEQVEKMKKAAAKKGTTFKNLKKSVAR